MEYPTTSSITKENTSLTMSMSNVSALVKTKRLFLGMSQRDLSRRLGFNESYFFLIEKERASIPLHNVHKVCIELGIPIRSFKDAWLKDRAQDFEKHVARGKA